MDTELTQIPSEHLEAQLTSLSARMAANMCEWLLLVGEFDRRNGHVARECHSVAHWLNWQCGIALGPAREHVRVARTLAELPITRNAFANGGLSYSKVRAITRVATSDNEAKLVEYAYTATASQVERHVRAFRTNESTALSNEQSQRDNRQISYRWLPDGSLQLFGRLTAEAGLLLLQAIKEFTRVPAETSDDTPSQRRADTLERICEQALLPSEASGTRSKTAMVVHTYPDGSHLHDGPSISNAAAERLACDCRLIDATTGASTQVVPPAMRRALNARDDHQCQFPGCPHRAWLDAHHRRHWGHGGETRLDNLLLLCRHHHGAVHDRGWTIGADGTFYDPYGRPAIVARPTADLVSVP